MGSWSVNCGISNITITAGTECVLLPLKTNENGEGYLPYLPATLPIFGEYDDYGGIENIIEDDGQTSVRVFYNPDQNCNIDYYVHADSTGYEYDTHEYSIALMVEFKEVEDEG